MKRQLFALVVVASGSLVALANAATVDDLRGPGAFASITDSKARSVMLFHEMGRVLQSPRCLNCHPAGDAPTQHETMDPHSPAAVRGDAGMGVPALECTACHGERNIPFTNGTGSIPGNPAWMLAPRSMAWQGKSLGEICRQLRDPERNGGRSLEQLVEHNTADQLVGWGWDPGKGRKPAPGSQAVFGKLTEAWVATGAECPD